MRNRVKIIRTHQTLFAEGYGQGGNVFPGSKVIQGLLMIRAVEGVEVSATGRPSFLVPWGNISCVDLFEEEYKGPFKAEDTNKVSQAV
jgi:hypothetical protein